MNGSRRDLSDEWSFLPLSSSPPPLSFPFFHLRFIFSVARFKIKNINFSPFYGQIDRWMDRDGSNFLNLPIFIISL